MVQKKKTAGSIPDGVEVFYRTFTEWQADGWIDDIDDDTYTDGWYWWSCFPGCLPDSDPFGPFETESAALADALNIDQ